MSQLLTLDDVDVSQKIVLVRADLNVPMQDGKVTDDTRIQRLLPTIAHLIIHDAKVILMSHFGRPKGQRSEEHSLRQILDVLASTFGKVHHGKSSISFAKDCIGPEAEHAAQNLKPGEILLLENLRFHPEEEKNDPVFAKALASLGDIYVNDAFSCSHRAHASVVGITQFLPSYAGRGMQRELEALTYVLKSPKRPLMAIVAGSKVSTKLALLKNLTQRVDYLVVGGGMANTFLKAIGYSIGQSICENDMMDTSRMILEEAKSLGCEVILPQDVVVTTAIEAGAERCVVPISKVRDEDKIADIGDATVALVQDRLLECATVVWNGPVGIFEILPFDVGSTEIAKSIAHLTINGQLVSVAGGGDTLAALAYAGCADDFTYTSTAGGAFLEWLEGKTLPGVAVLELKKVA